GGVPSNTERSIVIETEVTLSEGETARIKYYYEDSDNYRYFEVEAGDEAELRHGEVDGGVDTVIGSCEIKRTAGKFKFCAQRGSPVVTAGTNWTAIVRGNVSDYISIHEDIEGEPASTEWAIDVEGTTHSLAVITATIDCPECNFSLFNRGCEHQGVVLASNKRMVVNIP